MLRSTSPPHWLAAVLLSTCSPAFAGGDACTSLELPLANAILQTLEHSPQLDQGRSALDGARADRMTAAERPNPTLSFNSTNYDVRNGLGGGNAWDKRLDSVLRIDQPIERGDKRGLRVNAAAAGAEGAESDYLYLMRQLQLATTDAYYDLLHAEQKLQIDEQLAELQHQSETVAARRLEAGDIAEADLVRMRVESARADTEVQGAQADLDAARIALAHLMGCEGEATPLAMAEWPNPEAEPSLPDQMADTTARPDVQAAEARARQASALARLAEAQRTRDITVGLQYEHFPPDGQSLLGVGFSVPLFLFHHYDGEIARAHADANSAAAAARQAHSDAAADIAQSRSALRHAAERAQRTRNQLLPLSEKTSTVMDYAYAHGAAGVLDLLDARRTLHAARLETLDAQTDYAKALVAWQIAENLPQTLEQEAAP